MTALTHEQTPELVCVDSRGQRLRQVAYHRTSAQQAPERRVELSRVDLSGQSRRQWDPRRFQRESLSPSQLVLSTLSERVVLDESQDAGWQLVLPSESGPASETWDARGSHWQTEYDDLLRPVTVRENATRVAERFTYSGDSDFNQRGRLVRHDDNAGSRLIGSYSLTGHEQKQTRHFLAELDLPDWPDTELEPGDGSSTLFHYNPLGELLERADALGNRQHSRFTLIGELARSSLTLADGAEHLLLNETRYNPFGQIESQTAGNGVVTHAQYDPADGRLKRLSASRPGRSKLQDLHYAYDQVGNVLRIEDHSQPVRHFANQRVDPVSTFSYDSNGNLLELLPGQPLLWNARNQLHNTHQVTRDEGPDDEEHYRYGGDGLRVRKVSTRLVSGRMQSSETRYLPGLELHTRAGERFVVITTQAGRCAVRCLVWSEGEPEGVANPQLRYSLDDLHDSSGLELDGAANIISHEGYYPFGVLRGGRPIRLSRRATRPGVIQARSATARGSITTDCATTQRG